MHKLLAGMLLRPWALLLAAHAGRRATKQPLLSVTVHVYDFTSLSNTLPDKLYKTAQLLQCQTVGALALEIKNCSGNVRGKKHLLCTVPLQKHLAHCTTNIYVHLHLRLQ
jgi:hypothetical protein